MNVNVLVVDDDPLIRMALVRELRGAFLVLDAVDSSGAVAALEQHDIDAVVTDRELGQGPDGLHVLAEAARIAPEAVRVLVTGSAIDASIEAAIQSGLVWWLVEKPWSRGEITTAVRRGLQKYKALVPEPAQERVVLTLVR